MLPKLIFIIGAACSGKSSFIRAIDAADYICLDDVKPLYKIFKADELRRRNLKEFREFIVKNHLESFCAEDKTNSIAVDGGGYRITNPAVWDYILQITASEIIQGGKYIIEFSRGLDDAYIRAFNISAEDVYKRSLLNVIEHISPDFINDALIINIYSDFTKRFARNYQRRANGGHFVNEKSMSTIYKSDIFAFEHFDSNTGVFDVGTFKIPVYSFENKDCSDMRVANETFMSHYKAALNFYARIKNER